MPKRRRPGGGAVYPHTWILSPEYGILCYVHPLADQTMTKLWETTAATAFHDARLKKATRQINDILARLERKNQDPERKLSFIRFQNRHFLVWARYGVVGPGDDAGTIEKALKLKSR